MASIIRCGLYAILMGVGLAGCTPAAFVQRARPVQQCEVQVCTNFGTSSRCECKTRQQLEQQTRHGFWPDIE